MDMHYTRALLLIWCMIFMCSCSQDNPPRGEGARDLSDARQTGSSSSTAESERNESYVDIGASRGSAHNEPPSVLRASLRLENEHNLDTLRVLPVAADQDGDTVTLSYEWKKNGEPAGNGETLSGFKRGDNISVMITPYDGKEYGKPKSLAMEIQNTCPQATGHTEFVFNGTLLTTRIRAIDPDGDAVTYSLVTPPPGMTIEEESGLLRWVVPEEFVGRKEVMVKISDGVGGELAYTLPIEVTKLADKAAR